MPRKSLQINLHPTLPFRSSNLAIPPSPFTPRLPITPPATPPRPLRSKPSGGLQNHFYQLPPPPANPLLWIWQCHICHRQYKLGVTRRCLDDGHYFCSGSTVVRSRKDGARRTKKHRACGSEFDYKGWKEWGVWRRAVTADIEAGYARNANLDANDPDIHMTDSETEEEVEDIFTPSVVSPLFSDTSMEYQQSEHLSHSVWFKTKAPTATEPAPLRPEPPTKDCWERCDYPSDCRWGKSYGVQTPAAPNFSFNGSAGPSSSLSNAQDIAEALDRKIQSQIAEIAQRNQSKSSKRGPATDFKDILTPEQQNVADTIDGVSPPSSSSTSNTTIISLNSRSSSSQSSPFAASAAASANKTAFKDLASLVKSAQRRKSRTEFMGSSPLANPHVENSIPTSDEQRVRAMENPSRDGNSNGDHGSSSEEGKEQLLGFGFRRGMERANEIFAGVVGAVRGNSVGGFASAFVSPLASDEDVADRMMLDVEDEGEDRWKGWDRTSQRRRKERRG